MLIRVIDFETTGFPPGAGVCEAGWTDVSVRPDGSIEIGETVSRLCRPGLPIDPRAEAVHGISEAMVADKPPSSLIFREMNAGVGAFCAHNCEFEQNFFTGGDSPWICTYKVALARFPGLSSYKNGNLPGLLGIDLDQARCAPLHRAGPDTYVTAMILAHFIRAGVTPSEMIEITRKPKSVSRMPFGKHQGVPIADLPVPYMRWAVENLNAPDVVAAIKAALAAKEKRA